MKFFSVFFPDLEPQVSGLTPHFRCGFGAILPMIPIEGFLPTLAAPPFPEGPTCDVCWWLGCTSR